MSESAIRWARARCTDPDAPRLTEGERYLLTVLATYHSEIEAAWPTIADLADQMGYSHRRIQQLVAGLQDKGCLARNARGGRGHASDYTLALPIKGEIKGERVQWVAPFMEETKGERVQQRVNPIAPFGEPKGGELPGSAPSSSLPSPSFPTVTTETPGTTTAAAAGVQALVAVLLGQTGFETDPKFLAKLAAKYGHLDLEEEAIKMAAWLKSPAAVRKKRTCTPAFVLNWLKGDLEPREGRNNGRTAAAATAGNQPRAPDPYDRFGK